MTISFRLRPDLQPVHPLRLGERQPQFLPVAGDFAGRLRPALSRSLMQRLERTG
jgi:hypothetical protein